MFYRMVTNLDHLKVCVPILDISGLKVLTMCTKPHLDGYTHQISVRLSCKLFIDKTHHRIK